MSNHTLTPNTFVFSDNGVTSLGYVSADGTFFPFAKGAGMAAAIRNDNKRFRTQDAANALLASGRTRKVAAADLLAEHAFADVVVRWADGVNSIERVVGVVPDDRAPANAEQSGWFPGKYVTVVTQTPGSRTVTVTTQSADHQSDVIVSFSSEVK